MGKLLLAVFLPALFLGYGTALSVQANAEFCSAGVDSLAVRIAADLNSGENIDMIVANIEGRFGERLRSCVAARLMGGGSNVFLHPADTLSRTKYLLQSVINEYSLRYVGIGGGAFRQGRITRQFAISAISHLVGPDGKLVRSLESSAVVADTLNFDQAREARGGDSFLAPALPATTFQRVVEPGIIAGITGVLVYLFFASR